MEPKSLDWGTRGRQMFTVSWEYLVKVAMAISEAGILLWEFNVVYDMDD